ncbi:WAS/WASL-interacting protein family member 3 [Merluccius polli]|uniref:WAS/WASL-interacting protein family member 3 n=1 Tax=Merluccius polli TaxID=89951 RepID=A0AA47LZC3_MERPO|nr:WAS/WASL-interacting protein family member 3 [Merluccius polli]
MVMVQITKLMKKTFFQAIVEGRKAAMDEECDLQPSASACTGGGRHVFTSSSPASSARASSSSAALRGCSSADSGTVSCCIPGSWSCNVKRAAWAHRTANSAFQSGGELRLYLTRKTRPSSDPPKPQSSGGGGGRGALLADIQKGARLRKVTQVNDRSDPVVDKPSGGDVSSSSGGNQGAPGGLGPSLGGLFAGGFPTLRPIGQKETAKSLVSRSCSTVTPRPVWNHPPPGESSTDPAEAFRPTEQGAAAPAHRPTGPSYSAPPSPSHPGKQLPPPAPTSSPPPPPFSAPPPPPPPPPPPAPTQQQPPAPFQDRPVSRPPPGPDLPSPTSAPPNHQTHLAARAALPPPPASPPATPYSSSSSPSSRYTALLRPKTLVGVLLPSARVPRRLPGTAAASAPPGVLHPQLPHHAAPRRRPPPQARLGAPPLPPLPPSYPCSAPTPAAPRGVSRLAPPPAPPTRSPTTELSCRIPPPPPPFLPPASLRNGQLRSLDDFESKFQFHPVEDLPPPEEFKPFLRIYPSKQNRDVLHHALVMGVVGRVAVTLELLTQVLLHLGSSQSSLRSISWNDSWDLGPLRISMTSMTKVKVLSGQSRGHSEPPLLPAAHVLQALIPALDHLADAQREPHRLLVAIGVTGGEKEETTQRRQWQEDGDGGDGDGRETHRGEVGAVLEEALVMDQQDVAILGLAVAEEGLVQHLHLHLRLGELAAADDGHQQGGPQPGHRAEEHGSVFFFIR